MEIRANAIFKNKNYRKNTIFYLKDSLLYEYKLNKR